MRFFCMLFSFFFLIGTIHSQEDCSLINLDTYLRSNGFSLNPINSAINEGYSSEAQRNVFLNDLATFPVHNVLEIGFNAGHSCECFLNSASKPNIVCFDINSHSYTRVGVEFMQKKYTDRFAFIEGDSTVTVNRYADAHPSSLFDLIFIDGCHFVEYTYADIKNCKRLAHPRTLLWIDDYDMVQRAIDLCSRQRIIKVIKVHRVTDSSGPRSWAIAKYLK